MPQNHNVHLEIYTTVKQFVASGSVIIQAHIQLAALRLSEYELVITSSSAINC